MRLRRLIEKVMEGFPGAQVFAVLRKSGALRYAAHHQAACAGKPFFFGSRVPGAMEIIVGIAEKKPIRRPERRGMQAAPVKSILSLPQSRMPAWFTLQMLALAEIAVIARLELIRSPAIKPHGFFHLRSVRYG